MKYRFETANGHCFDVDCDPGERIQGVIVRAALDRGYDKLLSSLVFAGEELDPQRTLSEYNVQPGGSDVIILRGEKRRAEATAEEEEGGAIAEAAEGHEQGDHALFSLEALRDNIKKRREELDRPTFLTKEQRQKLALKRRQEAAQRQQERIAEISAARKEIFQGAGHRSDRSGLSAQERVERTEALYARIGREQGALADAAGRKQELDQIRDKYLGRRRDRKVVPKPAERFVKFTFDWSEHDDTSADLNPLYAKPHEAQLLYGRGFRAGIDAREQAKDRIVYEEEVEQREVKKTMERLQQERERKERRAAAKKRRREEAAAAEPGDGQSPKRQRADAAVPGPADGSESPMRDPPAAAGDGAD
eukprot:TRINITY_DN44024_c0_g1_i1.p1 TRINITY_DN44024_c0_g1~~TRINITY_DN44024_c0_g1_i1.p1  ORF type:complete len:363 (+),score=126.72 TRINITY_DN44024_c0_g1_i1:64-1152(+)